MGEREQNSRDRQSNKEGEWLIQLADKMGWEIANGNIDGDEEGE